MTTENLPTVSAEGASLGEAIRRAAEQLGVETNQVAHKFDREHFRSASGSVQGVTSVRIIAWARSGLDAPAPRPERSTPSEMPAPSERREPAREASAPAREPAPRREELVNVEVSDRSGGEAAVGWLSVLFGKMGLNGTVAYIMPAERTVVLRVDTPDARFIVGRRGTTLRAISSLLETTLGPAHPGWSFSIDVLDDRPDRGDRRPEGRDDGRGRAPRRERGPRHDGPRDDRPRRRTDDEIEELKRLARKLAEKAIETGESVAIRKELNSFERRIVHVEVAEIPGVRSESVVEGQSKRIIIIPDGASAVTEGPGETQGE